MIIEESLLYLNAAKDDCEAARILNVAKLYPHSILHLNQAVEKICKYYAIRNELIKNDEVKNKIGHNSLKLFTNILKNHFQSLEQTWKQRNDLTSFDFSHFFKELNSGFSSDLLKPKNLSRIDDLEMNKIILLLTALDRNDDLPTPIDYIFNTPENLIQGLLNIGIIEKSDLEKLETDKLENLKKELVPLLKLIPKYQKNILKLIVITSFFNNNINESRYPDLHSMRTPKDIFNENHSFVKYIPEIINHLASIIDIFRFFNEIKI